MTEKSNPEANLTLISYCQLVLKVGGVMSAESVQRSLVTVKILLKTRMDEKRLQILRFIIVNNIQIQFYKQGGKPQTLVFLDRFLIIMSNKVVYKFQQITMGANQQRPFQIEIAIERNLKNMQKELFDFTREKELISKNKITYPSYLHHYQKNNQVQYSLLEDPRNNLFQLNSTSSFSNELQLKVSQRETRCAIWKVIPDNKECQIQQGDRIKIGRVELYFKELRSLNCKKAQKYFKDEIIEDTMDAKTKGGPSVEVLKNSGFYNKYQKVQMRQSNMYSMRQSEYLMNSRALSVVSLTDKSCRICFDTNNSTNNPLFNVCNCSGSIKYVHYQCLKSWFKSKTVRFQTAHCIYYHYEPMQCDLCKYAISNQVIYQGRKYNLYEYEKIHPPYAKFQHYSDNKIFQILIRLEESVSIMIGRGAENDLNLNDSSISRSHCSFFYTSNRMLLKGLPSKYGTFIELSNDFELTQSEPLQLMVSNHLLTLCRDQEEKKLIRNDCCSGAQNVTIVVK